MRNYVTMFLTVGGVNYSNNGAQMKDCQGTQDEAVAEWIRRRNDISGRFPCWGDGMDWMHDPIAIRVRFSGGEVVDVVDAVYAGDVIPADEMFHLFDGCEA
jgi:hypothetical protein